MVDPDFLFRLSRAEVDALNRSQNATGSRKHRDPRFAPIVFTEHGAIMAATVLKSARGVEMSLYVAHTRGGCSPCAGISRVTARNSS